MTYYEIRKYKEGTQKPVANYGGGYTEEEVKAVMKGYRKEIIEFDPNVIIYMRRNCKYYYIVEKYEQD